MRKYYGVAVDIKYSRMLLNNTNPSYSFPLFVVSSRGWMFLAYLAAPIGNFYLAIHKLPNIGAGWCILTTDIKYEIKARLTEFRRN